jgi:ethanolamine ammonia-lyase large subunit
MGVPGADDIMLNYQSTSYHDVLAIRQMLDLAPAPEFVTWLEGFGLMNAQGLVRPDSLPQPFLPLLTQA